MHIVAYLNTWKKTFFSTFSHSKKGYKFDSPATILLRLSKFKSTDFTQGFSRSNIFPFLTRYWFWWMRILLPGILTAVNVESRLTRNISYPYDTAYGFCKCLNRYSERNFSEVYRTPTLTGRDLTTNFQNETRHCETKGFIDHFLVGDDNLCTRLKDLLDRFFFVA